MSLPSIPSDINAAPSALREEFINDIETLIDAAELGTSPTEGNDLLLRNNQANTINGLAGNDVIATFGGGDDVIGGEGNDYILAGAGDDEVSGQVGNDFIFGGSGFDLLRGGTGNDAMSGGADTDTLYGDDGDDWLFANAGEDRLYGGEGNDIVFGGAGNNLIRGGVDNDDLFGAGGRDDVRGGLGNDFLEGGAGGDVLSGGANDDVYFYSSLSHGGDTILDFNADQDRFEFVASAFGVEGGYNLDNGSTFIANANPVSQTGEATVLYETDTGRLYYDVDGTGSGGRVLIATLTSKPTITEQDFVFV
ncbi:MAG: calcium-binding protein [Hyphomonadaceae bacterium]|nr:calcium-binding protein [Hyphomonadaceae bacterium]